MQLFTLCLSFYAYMLAPIKYFNRKERMWMAS